MEQADTTAVLFNSVKDKEISVIAQRRLEFDVRDTRGDGYLGVAHSGGGIRSATFSLGILQYLAGSGLLKHVDYLSTVSGGGYIGSWLYSWIKREQSSSQPARPLSAFQKVCDQLNPNRYRTKPTSDPEPIEIAFLRQYSNYLTPHLGLFSADTWLVAATWARNALLNQAILIASFATVIMLIRLLGLGLVHLMRRDDFGAMVAEYDGWGFISAAVCASFMFPMLVIMGRNLNRISNISMSSAPPANRDGEITEKGVSVLSLFAVLAAVAYSVWMGTIRTVFVENGLIHGIIANWIVLFFAFWHVQRQGGSLQCHIAKRKEIGAGADPLDTAVSIALEFINPALAAFATACLLRAIALFLETSAGQPSHAWITLTWGPPLTLMALTGGVIVHIGLMGRDLPEASREWLGRLRGWSLIYTAVWIVLAGMSIYGPWLVASVGAWSTTTLATIGGSWILTTVGGLLAASSGQTNGKSDGDRPKRSMIAEIAAAAAPFIFIIGFTLAVSFAVHAILVNNIDAASNRPQQSTVELYDLKVQDNNVRLSRDVQKIEDSGFQWFLDRYWSSLSNTELLVRDTDKRWLFSGLLLLLPTAMIVALLLSWRVDINAFSLHNFYKNRLVRCYLGASRQRTRKPNPFTGFDDFDDLPLDCYTPDFGYFGPYPIVNAALNVSTGGKLQYQERQAQSFVFTPLYTGFSAETVMDEVRLGDETGESCSLSGYADEDAAPPSSGPGGPKAAGYRPTRYAGGRVSAGMATAISGAAVSPNMGYHTSTSVSFLLTLFNVRLGWWFGNPLKSSYNGLGPTFGLLYTIRELFGLANANSEYVNLSDGGHFDNMGIYELVRRKCRYIICCDGEQDPGPSFGGIGNAIRKCRTDFGVEIDLPLDRLCKVDGWSRTHCVVGRIKYNPEAPDEEHGYLVYMKTSLTGDEPSDLREYHARAPEFPQETTGDQWFDESQFESYRRLGYHIARKTFSAADVTFMDTGDRDHYFRDLYDIWYPPNAAVDQHSSVHADIYARVLEALRQDASLADLDQHLFPNFNGVPATAEWKRNQALLCSSLIQLMERIFNDLRLDDLDARQHPHVQGWMRIFRNWARTEPFQATWARTKSSYSERFREFYESLTKEQLAAGH